MKLSLTTRRAKLVVGFVIVALLPLLLLTLLNGRLTRQALIDDANQALFAVAQQTAASLDAFINANLNEIQIEAQLPPLIAYLELPADQRSGSAAEQEALALLRTLSRKNNYINSYALLDQNGVNLLDTLSAHTGTIETDQPYFTYFQQSGLDRSYVSSVQFPPTIGQPTLYFSSPVYDAGSGAYIGLLRVRYQAAVLQNLLADKNDLAGEGSFGVLFDEYHLHLAHGIAPEVNFLPIVRLSDDVMGVLAAANRLPPLPEEQLFQMQLDDLEEHLSHPDTRRFFEAEDIATGDLINQVALAEMTTQPWLIAFFQPQVIFLEPVRNLERLTVVLTAVIALLAVGTAVIVGRQLGQPIIELTDTVTQFTAGDLDARSPIATNDELGVLARSFNKMAAQVGNLLTGLEERTQALEQEIAERERAEAALQEYAAQLEARNEELDAFAGTVAHDLRTPLTPIMGMAQMLEIHFSADLDERGRRAVGTIYKNSQRMAQIIEALLLLARLRDQQPETAVVAMDEVVAETVDRLEHLIVEQEATIHQPAAWPTAVGYGPWLIEVWTNYISNALKYGGERPQVTLGATAVADSNMIRFWVRDEGPGISAAGQAKLFAPFARLEQGAIEGHGLGLSIVKRIIRKLDGEVGVESELGAGSTFWFSLPKEA